MNEEFFNHLLSTRVKNNESLPRSSSLSQVFPFSFSWEFSSQRHLLPRDGRYTHKCSHSPLDLSQGFTPGNERKNSLIIFIELKIATCILQNNSDEGELWQLSKHDTAKDITIMSEFQWPETLVVTYFKAQGWRWETNNWYLRICFEREKWFAMEQSATKAAVYMLCFWTAHVSHILASFYNGKKPLVSWFTSFWSIRGTRESRKKIWVWRHDCSSQLCTQLKQLWIYDCV